MTIAFDRQQAARLGSFVVSHRNPFIALLVALIAGVFVTQNRGEAGRIIHAIQNADPFWLMLALVTHVIVIGAAGLSYKIVLGNLGYHQPWQWLANLHLKRHVVGTVTPVGGPASIYVFVKALGKRGVGTDDALFAAAIRSVAGYGSFVLLLIPVLLVSKPSNVILAGAAALVVFLLAIVGAMAAILHTSCGPGWMMCRLPERLKTLIAHARTHGLSPRDLTQPFALAIVHNLLGVATLYFCLHAVGYQGGLTTAVVGYSIGNLFMMVAPIFQGIGVVELTMAVSLQHLGVPVSAAIAATFLYRFSDIWFPFILGLCTHASRNETVRKAASRAPVITVGLAGALILLLSLAPERLPSAFSVSHGLVVTVAIVAGAWCMLLCHALWLRRPVAQISAYGMLAVLAPVLAFEAGDVLGISIMLFHLATAAVIG